LANILDWYPMDLDKLAESFSSDVINEAISEIIEEDLKVSTLIIF